MLKHVLAHLWGPRAFSFREKRKKTLLWTGENPRQVKNAYFEHFKAPNLYYSILYHPMAISGLLGGVYMFN